MRRCRKKCTSSENRSDPKNRGSTNDTPLEYSCRYVADASARRPCVDPDPPHFVELDLYLSYPLELGIEVLAQFGDDLSAFVQQIDQSVVFGPRHVAAFGFRDVSNFTLDGHGVQDVYTRVLGTAVRIQTYWRVTAFSSWLPVSIRRR
jgi:hypothetical protein